MLFMNLSEIDEAVHRFGHKDTPLGQAVKLLAELRDIADQNSDGWCYWPAPCRAARQLQELIQNASIPSWRGPSEEPTEAMLKKAVAPIKAFYTKHKHHLTNGTLSFPC